MFTGNILTDLFLAVGVVGIVIILVVILFVIYLFSGDGSVGYSSSVNCEFCGDTGKCHRCDGDGEITGHFAGLVECHKCDGTGRCSFC